jgi:Mycothiol maleylpyruvate isomerase N-terminal domain
MNARDILKYGHQTVLRAVDGMPQDAWELPGVVGVWTAKDVVAHLASFEQVLVEILSSTLDSNQPTPTLELFLSKEKFNDEEVALRKGKTPAEALAEYEDWHAQAVAMAQHIPLETYRKTGILPWYGAEYDLEDFLVYTYYGHKREHSAQVALFKKRHAQAGVPTA